VESQSSYYRKSQRWSRRLVYLNLATLAVYLIVAVLYALDDRWGFAAIWIFGAGLWAACGFMNIDNARNWRESAEMYEEIER
jgi:hypothetical protein